MIDPKKPMQSGVLFSIHIQGETTGKLWPGEFRAKEKLSFRDRLNADRTRRELIGDAPGAVDPEIAGWAHALAQLSVRLTETPVWWSDAKNGLDLEDENVVFEVFQHAMKIERDYHEHLVSEGEAARAQLSHNTSP